MSRRSGGAGGRAGPEWVEEFVVVCVGDAAEEEHESWDRGTSGWTSGRNAGRKKGRTDFDKERDDLGDRVVAPSVLAHWCMRYKYHVNKGTHTCCGVCRIQLLLHDRAPYTESLYHIVAHKIITSAPSLGHISMRV